MTFRLITEDTLEDIILTEIVMVIEQGRSIKFIDKHENSMTVDANKIIFLTLGDPDDK